MSQKKLWLIVSFDSTTEALRGEKIFRQGGIGGQLIPTPRSVNASCGLCWRSAPQERLEIEKKLGQERLRGELLELLM